MLNEKNKAYMIRLDKEEARKKQQLAILRKTHDTAIQEKDMLIGELEAVVDDQESRLSGQYSTDLEKIFRKGNKNLIFSCGNTQVCNLNEVTFCSFTKSCKLHHEWKTEQKGS